MSDTIQYYGAAANPNGKGWAEVLATKVAGQRSTQEYTGVIYKTTREMEAAIADKNREIARHIGHHVAETPTSHYCITDQEVF